MGVYSQTDLVNEITHIFPEFAIYWQDDNREEEFRSESFHSVYMALLPFLGSIVPTQKQWQLLANHLSNAVASGGDLENAADTCILEHLHQVRLNKIIRPLLSKEAKLYVRM